MNVVYIYMYIYNIYTVPKYIIFHTHPFRVYKLILYSYRTHKNNNCADTSPLDTHSEEIRVY